MLSEYLKGYIDALCYPIYRGARDAGCVQVPEDQIDAAVERIQGKGCLVVLGLKTPGGRDVWAVRNHAVQKKIETLLEVAPTDRETYHRGVGKLLGYSDQHIRMFLETERPTV